MLSLSSVFWKVLSCGHVEDRKETGSRMDGRVLDHKSSGDRDRWEERFHRHG